MGWSPPTKGLGPIRSGLNAVGVVSAMGVMQSPDPIPPVCVALLRCMKRTGPTQNAAGRMWRSPGGRRRSIAPRQMKMSETLRELIQALEDSDRRFRQEVEGLVQTADRIIDSVDRITSEEE